MRRVIWTLRFKFTFVCVECSTLLTSRERADKELVKVYQTQDHSSSDLNINEPSPRA